MADIYKKTEILPCFFHFCQALWRKASELGLRDRKFLLNAKDMILNLKVLAFTKLEEVEKRFENIKRHFSRLEGNFEEFLNYFEVNWIKGRVFKKKIWNYSLAVIRYTKILNF